MNLKDRTEMADHSGRWTRMRYKTCVGYERMRQANLATYRYVLGEDWIYSRKGNKPENERVRVLSVKR